MSRSYRFVSVVAMMAAMLFALRFAVAGDTSLIVQPLEPQAGTLPDSSEGKRADDSDDKQGEKTNYEVHHVGVWLADPALGTINSREHFISNMPLTVDTTRPRRLKGDKKTISPLNVVSFYGQPAATLEIDLRAPSGSFVGHWPTARIKNNRLLWLDYQLLTVAPNDATWAMAPPDHWFATVRKSDDVLVLRKGARSEKFFAYDFESSIPLPLKLEGGPDTYELRSTASYPLHDVVIVAPSDDGRRIGWLDVLPAAHEKKPGSGGQKPEAKPAVVTAAVPQPVAPMAVQIVGGAAPVAVPAGGAQPSPQAPAVAEGTPGPAVQVAMSKPMMPGSEEWTTQSKTKLSERLAQTGLAQREVDLLLSLYEPAIFSSDSLTVIWRLPSSMVDEFNAMTFDPEPTKTIRVVFVIARNLDPKIATDLQKFVDQLGSPDYKLRESAEKRLAELGSLAFPVLKKALVHNDPEIAFRAERLLLDQKQSIDVPATPDK